MVQEVGLGGVSCVLRVWPMDLEGSAQGMNGGRGRGRLRGPEGRISLRASAPGGGTTQAPPSITPMADGRVETEHEEGSEGPS